MRCLVVCSAPSRESGPNYTFSFIIEGLVAAVSASLPVPSSRSPVFAEMGESLHIADEMKSESFSDWSDERRVELAFAKTEDIFCC